MTSSSSPSRSLTSAPNRFRARGLALSAAGTGCALASAAQAQIVYSGIQNLSVASGATTNTQKIDFDSDGTADLSFYYKGPRLNAIGESGGSETGEVVLTAPGTGGSGIIAKLAAGTVISGASSLSTGHSVGNNIGPNFTGSAWSAGDTGYVGFSFVSGGNTYYGWADVKITALGTSGSGTIIDWAYNSTPGGSILAGQIPEPATAALGAGVVALGGALWLKRRWRPS